MWVNSSAPARRCLAVALLAARRAAASAQEMNPALKELAAAANKEGTVTLSWSQSTLGGSQGAARFQAAMNKTFGTNIRINFLPGPDMARIVNQLATEFSAGQKAHVDIVLGAAPQIAPVVKVNFFEPVDWKQYLPGRITADMIELDGRIIRIVTGLSGVTYNSQLAPDEADDARGFPQARVEGQDRLDALRGRLRRAAGRGRLGQGEDRRLCARAVAADHRR